MKQGDMARAITQIEFTTEYNSKTDSVVGHLKATRVDGTSTTHTIDFSRDLISVVPGAERVVQSLSFMLREGR
jgi:hypothetical protein